ncbi:MAG TPA: nucleotidyl transferase AbiEii/AbiGii toxin family protein [Steroidobacteraceae bacterium]|nr:nucleotidyl transferase AbiEii/AbiGii toxin family protein [Steroidobacteraceae bacterium]
MLPEPTERLLRTIDVNPSAKDLLLVGGTALTLRIAHRRSADLDFAFSSKQLPRRRIDGLLDDLRAEHEIIALANVAAERDFLDSGLEISDYQRDYSVGGVKVTFFTPDPAKLGEALRGDLGVHGLTRIRVADLDSLFRMKAVTLNSRTATRDLFDVYTLVRKHGYREEDIFGYARLFDFSPDTLKTRLRHARRRADDPGIEVPDGVPPTFEQLQAFFVEAVNRVEQEQAERAIRQRLPKPSGAGSADPKRGSLRERGPRKKSRRPSDRNSRDVTTRVLPTGGEDDGGL